MDWLVLQLADSAFPTGGFAHSSGLEVAVHAGEVRGEAAFARFLRDAAWQTGRASLPFVRGAFERGLVAVDARCDAFLVSNVANRASRTQGRALVEAFARIFPHQEVADVRRASRGTFCHFAPAFGSCARAVALPLETTQRLFLHGAVRGVASAAVRLGVIGPHRAQRLQLDLAPELDRVLASCAALDVERAATTAPLQELLGAAHDRLYSRLFQS